MIIFQKPNLSLIIAAIAFLISKISTGAIHAAASTIFTIAIIIWAYEELANGVNTFRKILGGVVLVVIAASLFIQFR